jgi:rare lipoprotein A
MKLFILAFAAALFSSAYANVGAPENPPALIGEELTIEVLPDNLQLSEAQEQRLQEVGFLQVRPVQYAANGLVTWFKNLSSGKPTQERSRTEGRRSRREVRREERHEEREVRREERSEVRHESHRARVISTENEASSSNGHSFHGLASYYGGRHSGKYKYDHVAAHPSLPFGTLVKVTHNGKSVIVMINDRGPFIRGRVIDIDTGAARSIDLIGVGVGHVTCEVM